MKISPVKTLLFLLFLLILNSCGNDHTSNGGSGQAEPETELVGPNLNGDDWAGYYKSANGKYVSLAAVIRHRGNRVSIQTSIKSGVASMFTGTIDASGRMTMYDAYDNEDWTTLYGPASRNSINLADYVFKDNQKTDTNIIVLKR